MTHALTFRHSISRPTGILLLGSIANTLQTVKGLPLLTASALFTLPVAQALASNSPLQGSQYSSELATTATSPKTDSSTAPSAYLENDTLSNDIPLIATLPTISVTATRIPTAINHTITQTTIINSEGLQQYQGQTVLDVLRAQAGMLITQSGGLGTASNFYMRGFDGKQVLVLIDGVRYGSATLGTPSLSLIPVEQIERIEVVRGSSGVSLYGADAMGGVIQIFSKGGVLTQRSGRSSTATLGIGSHQHYHAGFSSQHHSSDSSMHLGISKTQTDGFNAVANADAPNFQPDKDGFESINASFGISHDVTERLSTGISALYSQSITDIDTFDKVDWTTGELIAARLPHAYAQQQNGTGNVFVQYDSGRSMTKLSYGHSLDNSTTFETSTDHGDVFDTTQQSLRLERVIQVGQPLSQPVSQLGYQDGVKSSASYPYPNNTDQDLGQLIIGAEYLKQSVDSSISYDKTERDISSGFIGYQYADERYELQGSYRLDDNSQYGQQANYSVGAAINPAAYFPDLSGLSGVSVGMQYATGFRAPTFNDLYYPNYGNTDLKPETSKTLEVFAEYTNDIQRSRLTRHRTRADNLILGGDNIGKTAIEGISLTSDWTLNALTFGLGYDYMKATDDLQSSETYANELPYRPKHSGLIYMGFNQPTYHVRLEAKYTDKRYSDIANTTSLDGYTLINVYGSMQLTPNLQANLRINNLTDTDYTTSNQYGTQYATDGINYFGALTYTW